MKPLVILSTITALAVLSSCKKETTSAGAADKNPRPSGAQPHTAAKPPLPGDLPAAHPPIAPPPAVAASPERSKQLADALALTDPIEREAAINRFLGDLPPARAADILLAELPANPAVEEILGTVLTKFAIDQPSASAAWLSAAPDFSGKATAVRATADLWQRTDFAATLQWIDSLPAGANRQSALKAIADHIASRPAEHRSTTLDAISNAQLRGEVKALIGND